MDLTFRPSGFVTAIPDTAEKRASEYSSTMMDHAELSCLAGAALAYPWSPTDLVVEIGSYEGTTAAFLAETLFDAGHQNHIVSIDPFERAPVSPGNPHGSYEKYLQTMRDRGLEDRCVPLVAFSQHAAAAVPDRIGLLIIDADHEYESVERDLALYAPKVLRGGFIFLDDYTEGYPGVVRATDEFVAGNPEFRFLHQSYFAILQRKQRRGRWFRLPRRAGSVRAQSVAESTAGHARSSRSAANADPILIRMRSFLLVFYRNTGSSWLIQIIGSDPRVFVPGFEPLDKWAWKVADAERLEWMRGVFSPPEDRSGPAYDIWLDESATNPQFSAPRNPEFSMAGFKMRADSIEDHPALLKLLLDSESRVIVLERRNRIKHALSVYRHREEGKSQFDNGGVLPPSKLDLDLFHAYVEESVALHSQSEVFWDHALEMLGPEAVARVQYEDFINVGGKDATMERLGGFLDLPGYTYNGSAFQKATPDNLASAVVNFDELVERYIGTEFEQFLSE